MKSEKKTYSLTMSPSRLKQVLKKFATPPRKDLQKMKSELSVTSPTKKRNTISERFVRRNSIQVIDETESSVGYSLGRFFSSPPQSPKAVPVQLLFNADPRRLELEEQVEKVVSAVAEFQQEFIGRDRSISINSEGSSGSYNTISDHYMCSGDGNPYTALLDKIVELFGGEVRIESEMNVDYDGLGANEIQALKLQFLTKKLLRLNSPEVVTEEFLSSALEPTLCFLINLTASIRARDLAGVPIEIPEQVAVAIMANSEEPFPTRKAFTPVRLYKSKRSLAQKQYDDETLNNPDLLKQGPILYKSSKLKTYSHRRLVIHKSGQLRVYKDAKDSQKYKELPVSKICGMGYSQCGNRWECNIYFEESKSKVFTFSAGTPRDGNSRVEIYRWMLAIDDFQMLHTGGEILAPSVRHSMEEEVGPYENNLD